MTNEITKNLMCISMRNGIEIWLEEDRIKDLKSSLLMGKESKFVMIDNEMINTADIVGIFDAVTMQDVTRRKNGQWKDTKGGWHNKGEQVCKCGNVVPFGMRCGYCSR